MAKGNPLRRAPEGEGEARETHELRAQDGIAETAALDRLIHGRIRLGILSALAVNQVMSFNELKQILGTTDGNLSVHAQKLEDAGYVECAKSFEGRVPRTDYGITTSGRRALEQYLGHMEALIRTVREG